MTTTERLFSVSGALDHPVTVIALCVIGGLLVTVPILALVLHRLDKIKPDHARELIVRCLSWIAIVCVIIAPILLGAFWAMLIIFLLAVGGFLEYARMTGLLARRTVTFTVLVGIGAVFFAVVDHWYGLFVALMPLGVVTIAAAGLIGDEPKGYLKRVALGALGFLLFGAALGHLAYFANSTFYRPLLIIVLFATSMNDVFAYTCGKLFGKRKLCPNTSPNKTVGGAVGALVLTTTAVALLGQPLLKHAPGLGTTHLIAGGLILSLCGQLGDLVMSAIKRDIGVKDTGTLIPGHGGLLDRLDSLLLTSPATFHFVGYFVGIGLDQQTRIISGN